MQTPLIFILAFVFVLALIALAAWLVRRFGGKGLGNAGSRGRMPRLAVIDAAAVDGRRRLVLVRRDNVEHLLMIGGPTDIVVEPNIVRGRDAAARESQGRDQRPGVSSEFARAPESGFIADAEPAPVHAEPQQPEAPRPPRPSFADELRRPAPAPAPAAPVVDRRSDALANFTPEPITRLEPPVRPEPRLEPRSEPQPARTGLRSEPLMPRPPSRPLETGVRAPMPRANVAPVIPPATTGTPPAPTEFVSEADQNLAAMAQRLEAALRRPTEPNPAPEPRTVAPPVSPPSAPPAPPANGPASAPSIKTGFENLEDEMASLLGRPKNPS